MTVRIAAVTEPDDPVPHPALARARALSAVGAPELQWWPVPADDVEPGAFDGYDGVWLTRWPHDPASEPLRRAAWRAQELGTPLVVWPQEPPADFVVQARARAAYRSAWEIEQRAAAALAAAEQEPRPYVHQMRGPRMRWWRPLLALLVALLGLVVVGVLTVVPLGLAGAFDDDVSLAESVLDPMTSLSTNLLLAGLIPVTMLGLWAGFRRSPGRVLSVTGRLRWGWLGWCLLVITPLWVAYLAVSWVVFDQEVLDRPEHWVALLLIMVLTTPLQAAGEEIATRGGLAQGVGAWIPSPVAGLVVTTLLSAGVFAALHGSADPWIVLELGTLAVAGCWLAWRTGGLEAAIALHVVNNLLVMTSGILLGGLQESYVSEASEGSPVSALMNVVATAVVTAVLLWCARRRGIAPAGWATPARG